MMWLAAWFGGTLANAVGLNRRAAETDHYSDAGRVANASWDAGTPVNAAAIGAYLVGSVGQSGWQYKPSGVQEGGAAMAITKTALTVSALVVTAYARLLGRKVAAQPDAPVASGTEPIEATPRWRRRSSSEGVAMGSSRPTAALIVVTAYAGEQQRPAAVKAVCGSACCRPSSHRLAHSVVSLRLGGRG